VTIHSCQVLKADLKHCRQPLAETDRREQPTQNYNAELRHSIGGCPIFGASLRLRWAFALGADRFFSQNAF
jgi:hypothetical protein